MDTCGIIVHEFLTMQQTIRLEMSQATQILCYHFLRFNTTQLTSDHV